MAEITLHTGLAGDRDKLNIDWFDHNNVQHKDVVDVIMEPYDKPRTLTIVINGKVVYQTDGHQQTFG